MNLKKSDKTIKANLGYPSDSQVIDYSRSLHKDKITGIIKRVTARNAVNLWVYIDAFTEPAWWAIGLAALCLGLFYHVTSWEDEPIHRMTGFRAVALSLMNKETPNLMVISISCRLLLTSLWLLSIVLWAYYNANLTTTMTVNAETAKFEYVRHGMRTRPSNSRQSFHKGQ